MQAAMQELSIPPMQIFVTQRFCCALSVGTGLGLSGLSKGETPMVKTKWGVGLMALVLGVVGVFELGMSAPVRFDRLIFVEPEGTPAWVQRIALVDEALGRSELSRAVYEWREAYGAAVRTSGPEGLIAVADRAIRIAERSGGSGYFRTEATNVYTQAALRAHAQGSRDTILEIADTFDRLGDPVRATHMRRLARDFS